MKTLTEDLKFKIHQAHAGGFNTRLKWNEIYDSEEELINDMFSEKVKTSNTYYYNLCKGYEFINGFRKYYSQHGCLTEKQMVQLKRLASEIAFWIYCK